MNVWHRTRVTRMLTVSTPKAFFSVLVDWDSLEMEHRAVVLIFICLCSGFLFLKYGLHDGHGMQIFSQISMSVRRMAAHVTTMPTVSTTMDPLPVLAKMDLQEMEQFVLVNYPL